MDAYVYGVIAAGAAGWRPPGDGIDDQPVELVERGEIAALVSNAPRVPVKANRRNLMAHSRVLQSVIGERCVLPMRFGVVMPDRAAVEEELLAQGGDWLAAQLRVFETYVELDVRALCPEEDLLRAVVRERPQLAELRESLRGRPGPATYYERIRLGELVAAAVAEKREEVASRVVDTLSPLAAATKLGDPLHEQMLANVAFLVDRGRIPEFDAAVETLDAALGESIRLRYTGPLPPHNFVDVEAGTEAEAWA
jgi:Gas vesicle synthesis protein GvpL/GvpF